MALSAAGDAGGQHKIGYFALTHGPAGKAWRQATARVSEDAFLAAIPTAQAYSRRYAPSARAAWRPRK